MNGVDGLLSRLDCALESLRRVFHVEEKVDVTGVCSYEEQFVIVENLCKLSIQCIVNVHSVTFGEEILYSVKQQLESNLSPLELVFGSNGSLLFSLSGEEYLLYEGIRLNGLEECNFDISWLFSQLDSSLNSIFSSPFDSSNGLSACYNNNVHEMKLFCEEFSNFLGILIHFFECNMSHSVKERLVLLDSAIFNPIIPWMTILDKNNTRRIFSLDEISTISKEHKKSFSEHKNLLEEELNSQFSDVSCYFALKHCSTICNSFYECIILIDTILQNQFIDVIGKQIGPKDIHQFMVYSNRREFLDEYKPVIFSYPVKLSSVTIGTIQMEQKLGNEISEPIQTFVNSSNSSVKMMFTENQKYSLNGKKYFHGWLRHEFRGASDSKLRIYARAKPFCSYVLLLGQYNDCIFTPLYGTVIQSKDELTIPIECYTNDLSNIPPEQREFIKKFRKMKKSVPFLGICIIQLKELIEKVLNLPSGSLSKNPIFDDIIKVATQVPLNELISGNDISSPDILNLITSKLSSLSSIVGQKEETIISNYTPHFNSDYTTNFLPTLLFPGYPWELSRCASIISRPQKYTLDSSQISEETSTVFHILKNVLSVLDGPGSFDCDLHIVQTTTHYFDHTLMDTIVKGNINPIDPIQNTTERIASSIHQQHVNNLLNRKK